MEFFKKLFFKITDSNHKLPPLFDVSLWDNPDEDMKCIANFQFRAPSIEEAEEKLASIVKYLSGSKKKIEFRSVTSNDFLSKFRLFVCVIRNQYRYIFLEEVNEDRRRKSGIPPL